MSSEIGIKGGIGSIIGAGAGLWLSNLFIFPTDVINLKFADMTIGFFLRILGGLFPVLWGGVIGAAIVESIGKK
jgi:hypothetical protein